MEYDIEYDMIPNIILCGALLYYVLINFVYIFFVHK